MNQFVKDVVDFNQRILNIEPRSISQLQGGEYTATLKALEEEIEEFKDAHDMMDLVGEVDAIVDLMYFSVGALYKMGLTEEQIGQCMNAVHVSNMRKKLGVVEKRGNPLGDAVKPNGWTGPEEAIAHILGG